MITSNQIIDSDRMCPRCHKRMMLDIGQDDVSGWTRMVHHCWSCGHREIDENWRRRPRPSAAVRAETLAAKLARNRLEGVVIPLKYDDSPFPKSEFDEVSDAS